MGYRELRLEADLVRRDAHAVVEQIRFALAPTVRCSRPSAAARLLPYPVLLGRSRPARATREAVGDVAVKGRTPRRGLP